MRRPQTHCGKCGTEFVQRPKYRLCLVCMRRRARERRIGNAQMPVGSPVDVQGARERLRIFLSSATDEFVIDAATKLLQRNADYKGDIAA